MSLRVVNGQVVQEGLLPVRVSFYEHAKQTGVGQYTPTPYVLFKNPGSRDVFSREATDKDKAEHADAWDLFLAGVEPQKAQDTPLNFLPDSKSAFILEFAAMGIRTVEQLAGIGSIEELSILYPEDDASHLEGMLNQALKFTQMREMLSDV
jgi:hypothetical protein